MNTRVLCLASFMLAAAAATVANEVEVLFDGTHIEAWDVARDAERLKREFSLSELKAASNPAALVWRFVPRGVPFNDLFLHRPITRDFETIRVRVRNQGAALTFAAKVREASGAEWATPQVPLAASNDWQWVEFARRDWRPAGWSRDADGRLDFPLAYFTIIAFGLEARREYRLEVARVEVVRTDPPRLVVHEFCLPETLSAGQTGRCTLEFSMDKPGLTDEAQLVFRRENADLLRLPLELPAPSKLQANQQVTLRDFELRLPLYAPGGVFSVRPEIGGAQLSPPAKPATLTVVPRQPGKTTAEIRPHNGTPTLFINGHPHDGMAWATYGPTAEVFRDFTQAGVTLYTFSGTPTEAGYGLSKTTWTAPDQFDYSEFDQRVLMLLGANPNAYIFPRLYLHAPKWWSERHPEDVVLLDPGDEKPVPLIHSGGKPAPSWASEAWRCDTAAALRRMIAHIEASPYADRVIGYHLASGTTEEWMMWGANENEWVDYSPANLTRFSQWLREKYGSVEQLRRAWHDDSMTFETAAIPTKAQRQQTSLGSLRDPAREQPTIDFYRYNSELVAGTINYFARTVKEATHREKIVGVFYGYLLQLCGEQRQQNAGHLALGRVLASPDIDFLTSPTSYAFRQLGGEGTAHFMSLFDSVKLHGKLWFNENDVRTSLSGGQAGEWGRPANLEGDFLQQDKELALALTYGAAQWWFDVGGNKYNHPRLMGRIGELVKAASAAQSLDRSAVDEVAMVVDEQSLCRLRVGDPLGNWLLVGQLPALQRIGAPVGHYLVNDLPRLQRHKVLLFMTSFAPTDEDRRAVDSFKRDGHVLVFFGFPGLYRDGQLDESAMRELTGINLRLAKEPTALRVSLVPGREEIKGLDGVYGVAHQASPVCYADDPEAQVLGTLPDGRAGLVIRRHPGWTAIYSAAPLMPTPLLCRLAELGGVHFYTPPGDVVWATKDLVGVSVHQAGSRTITLPRPATITDLYTGAQLGDNLRSFRADFADRATRVFTLAGPQPKPGMVFSGKTWQQATPQSQGIDAVKLKAALNYLERELSDYGGAGTVFMVRNGYAIWAGPDSDQECQIYSATKSFTSTVLGLLIQDGKVSLNTLAKDLEPTLAVDYPAVTLRHFATMTSGYDTVGGNYEFDAQGRGDSWNPGPPAPPLFPPGSKFRYWDDAMSQFGSLLTKAAGKPLDQVFKARIADPIGMTAWRWTENDTPTGRVLSWQGGIWTSSRELARFGHLFLNRGNWNGRQLIDAAWVDQATRVQVPATVPNDSLPRSRGAGVYGYNWWVNGIKPNGQRLWPGSPPRTYYANGLHNNVCIVVPEWNLVIARTNGGRQNGSANSPSNVDEVWSGFFSRLAQAVSLP